MKCFLEAFVSCISCTSVKQRPSTGSHPGGSLNSFGIGLSAVNMCFCMGSLLHVPLAPISTLCGRHLIMCDIENTCMRAIKRGYMHIILYYYSHFCSGTCI